MLDVLISSKTRIRLLLRLFLNRHTEAHLRGLEQEFGESSNAVRVELNRFEEAGLLIASTKGNKKLYRANQAHPLFEDIHNILLKYIGIDQIIEHVLTKLGDIEEVYLSGKLVRGLDSTIIDLILVGYVNKPYLLELLEKTEHIIRRKIRYLIYEPSAFKLEELTEEGINPLLLWRKG